MTDITNRLIRWSELKQIVGVSRSTIDRWEKEGKFPKRFKIGSNTVAWSLEEVNDYISRFKNAG